MIIIEGPDNSGKTKLREQLLEMDPNLHLIHRDRFDPKREETIATSYIEAILGPRPIDLARQAYGLADRMFLSECIYGQLFRGGCRMSQKEHRSVVRLMSMMGTLFIICDPGDAAIESTWDEREQLYDRAILIARAYRNQTYWPREFIGPQSNLRIHWYNWTAPHALALRRHFINEHRFMWERLWEGQDEH